MELRYLKVGNSHTASIEQEVGNDDGALLCENLICSGRDGAISTLTNNLSLDATGIVPAA
jgi:hypothetical protein